MINDYLHRPIPPLQFEKVIDILLFKSISDNFSGYADCYRISRNIVSYYGTATDYRPISYLCFMKDLRASGNPYVIPYHAIIMEHDIGDFSSSVRHLIPPELRHGCHFVVIMVKATDVDIASQ